MEIVIIVLGILFIAEPIYFGFIQARGLQKQIDSMNETLGIQGKINHIFAKALDSLREDMKDLVDAGCKYEDVLNSHIDIYNNFVDYVEEDFVKKGPKKTSKAKPTKTKEKVVKKVARRGRPKKK